MECYNLWIHLQTQPPSFPFQNESWTHQQTFFCLCCVWACVFLPAFFGSLCCEVLSRSRRCVGEEWMNEWVALAGLSDDGGANPASLAVDQAASGLWFSLTPNSEARTPPPEWDHSGLLARNEPPASCCEEEFHRSNKITRQKWPNVKVFFTTLDYKTSLSLAIKLQRVQL